MCLIKICRNKKMTMRIRCWKTRNSNEKPEKKSSFRWFILKAVHRVVFGWPALDLMRSPYRKRENTNSWTKEIFMDFLNFPRFLLEFFGSSSSRCRVARFSIFNFRWNLREISYQFFSLSGTFNATFSYFFFFIFWSRAIQKIHQTILDNFSWFFWRFSRLKVLQWKINDRFWATVLNGPRSKSSACFDKKSLSVLTSWPPDSF
jgi:hypothetical protein